MKTRPAYFAGPWYPAAADACKAAIERHAADTTPGQGPFQGLIGPHAGWTYSGNAAAQTYRWLAEARADVDLVVVFGSHRGAQGPNTVFRADAWDTPLGPLANAKSLADRVAAELDLQDEPVSPARPDNGAELHLPFVRFFFPKAELLMLGVAASPRALSVGEAVGKLVAAEKRRAVFVGSTDLTHYGPNYGFMPKGSGDQAIAWVRNENDRGFVERILASDPPGIIEHAETEQSACCPGAVAAALVGLRAYGVAPKPTLVSHYLSYDVQPASSYVGYAGLVL